MQTLGFAIAVLGSGVGWLAVVFGKFTSDFWVAEAYPFLSMYTNPHFSLGLGLMILALIPDIGRESRWYTVLGIALGIVQPFAVVIVILALSIQVVIELEKSRGKAPVKIKKPKTVKNLLTI